LFTISHLLDIRFDLRMETGERDPGSGSAVELCIYYHALTEDADKGREQKGNKKGRPEAPFLMDRVLVGWI
jgi:hypothetical protein